MIDDKKMELLKKLKALAESGVGGEQQNAQRKLTELMKKYGVEDADLSDEKLDFAEFRYVDKFDRQILRQCFAKINSDRRVYKIRGSKQKREYWKCTKAEEIQARIEFDFYRELWKEEIGIFIQAFIQKHELYAPFEDTGEHAGKVDKETLRRIIAMMHGLQDKELTQRIEAAGGGGSGDE